MPIVNLFHKINFKTVLKELLLMVLVLVSVLFLALSINIFPPFALIILVPIVLTVFILLPKFKVFPSNKLKQFFFLWVIISTLWPFFIVLHIPGFVDLHPGRIILAVLLLVWLYYISKSKDMKVQLFNYVNYSRYFFIIIAFVILTKFWGIVFSGSFFSTFNAFFRELLQVVVPTLMVLSLITTRKEVEKFISLLVWVGVVVVVVGLLEYRIQANVFSSFLPASFISDQEHVAAAVTSKVRGEFRLQSVFAHPLVLAQYLVLLFPLLVYKVIITRRLLLKTTLFMFLILLLFVVFNTGSRAVLPGLAAEIIAFLVIYFFKVICTKRAVFWGWLYVAASPLLFLAGLLLLIKGRGFLMGQTDAEYLSTQARIEMWDRGINVILSDPLAGLFGFGLSRGALIIDWQIAGNYTIDSYFLSVLVETGVIGFLLFLFILVLTFKTAFATWTNSKFSDHLQVALMLSIVGFTTIAFILSLTHLLHIFYFLIALVFITRYIADNNIASK